MSFLLNYGYLFEIRKLMAPPNSPMMRIAAGIKSTDPDNNEETEENAYYDGGGASERDVIGSMLSYGFEGHRKYGDEAQDYIFKLVNKLGPDRKVFFKVTEPNGDRWEGPATVSEIKLPGGDANAKGEISFTISFDGQPTFIENPNGDNFPPLNTPTGLSVTDITTTGAKVSWSFTPPSGTTEPVQFDVFVNGTEIDSNVTVNEYTMTGLTADTDQTVEVRAQYVNSTNVVSAKSQPANFKTLA